MTQVELHLLKNGQPAGHGFGSAVQGHPCAAVAWLANTLGKFDIPLTGTGEIDFGARMVPLVISAIASGLDLKVVAAGGKTLRGIQRIARRASSPGQHLHVYAQRQSASRLPDLR